MRSVLLSSLALVASASPLKKHVQPRTSLDAGFQLGYEADANVTYNDASYTGSYRFTALHRVGSVISYVSSEGSAAAEADENSISASSEFDLVTGLAYAAFTLPPTHWLSYVQASSTFAFDLTGSGNAAVSGSLEGAASLVATTYLNLQEINAAGEVVNTVPFNLLVWSSEPVVTDGTLHRVKLTGNDLNILDDFKVTWTVLASDVTGVLNMGGATLTPTSNEDIIEITGYDYRDSANHLRLNMGSAVGSAELSADYSGSVSGSGVSSGSGASRAYIHLSGEAFVDGANAQVTTSRWVEGTMNDLGNAILSVQMQAMKLLGFSFSLNTASVDFPANAASITYDPAIGFGASSGTHLVPAFFLAIALLFFSL